MDFILTNEQMCEFIKRYFDEINKKSKNKYGFKVISYEHPNMATISATKDDSSATICHVIFTDDTVYFMYFQRVKGVVAPYIAYMYELFGEDYLMTIETTKKEQIAREKAQAYTQLDKPNEYFSHLDKELDDELSGYLSYLNEVRNTVNLA